MSKSELKRLTVQHGGSMDKKVVYYDKGRGVWPEVPVVGSSVMCYPLNHTSSHVSNTTYARTSKIVRVESDGTFETLNSIYVPKEVTDGKVPKA